MNMDNTFFWREDIAIITASSLTAEDKKTIKQGKGSGKDKKKTVNTRGKKIKLINLVVKF